MPGLLRVRLLFPLIMLVLAACASEPPVPGMARIPRGALITHRAVFIGEDNHDTVGTVSLYQSSKHPVIVFEPNFSLDAAEAVVALGARGYRPGTVLGALLKPSGSQAYAVPRGTDIRLLNEVWLWNPKSGKPLGLARLVPV